MHRTGSHAYIAESGPRREVRSLLSSPAVEVLGDRDDRTLSRERAARSHRLVRALTQHPRSECLRRLLRQFPRTRSSERTRTRSARLTSRIAGSCAARSVCQAHGCSRRSTNGAPASPGRRSTSSRTSSARATRSGRLPRVSTFDFSLTRPFRFKKYRFTAGLRVYNVFARGDERDVQSNITAPDYGTFYNPIQRSIGIVLSAGFP